jgi:hypothetical protein
MSQNEKEEKENSREKGIVLPGILVLRGSVIEEKEVVQEINSLFVVLILDLIEIMVQDYQQENRQVS